jgi:transposase
MVERYIQEGTNDLNDKPRSGRPSSKLPEEIVAFQLRKELLLESKQASKQAGLEYY